MEISQKLGHCPRFDLLMVDLGTLMTPLGVSLSLLMCYKELILRIKV